MSTCASNSVGIVQGLSLAHSNVPVHKQTEKDPERYGQVSLMWKKFTGQCRILILTQHNTLENN